MDHISLREGLRRRRKKNSAQGFYAVCEIRVMAEWVRDQYDCLWDGGEMRNNQQK